MITPYKLTLSIRQAKTAQTKPSVITQQVMTEIGKKEGVLDTLTMQAKRLGKAFASFNVESITPTELGLVSKNLYALGYIDKTTANLMLTAGTSLDAFGNQTQPDTKINALDYFAARIHSLKQASTKGNDYAFHVVPDYIKTVHALLNLDDFAKSQALPQTATSKGRGGSSASRWKGFSAKV